MIFLPLSLYHLEDVCRLPTAIMTSVKNCNCTWAEGRATTRLVSLLTRRMKVTVTLSLTRFLIVSRFGSCRRNAHDTPPYNHYLVLPKKRKTRLNAVWLWVYCVGKLIYLQRLGTILCYTFYLHAPKSHVFAVIVTCDEW